MTEAPTNPLTPATPAQPEGAAMMQKMIDAGAPADQVHSWAQGKQQQMMKAGAPQEEVEKYWGTLKPETKPIADMVGANIDALDHTEKAKIADSPTDILRAGWQHGAIGLVQGKPNLEAGPDMGIGKQILYGGAQMASDLPAMGAGFLAGAAVGSETGPGAGLTALAGTAAVPTAFRETMMKYYNHPDGPFTWQEIAKASADISWETTKSAVEGMVGGKIAGAVGSKVIDVTGSKIAGAVGSAGAFSVAAGTTAAAFEGHVPNAEDFVTGAILMLGFHIAGSSVGATKRFVASPQGQQVVKNLQSIYERTDVTPQQAVQMSVANPALKSEILATRTAGGDIVTPEHDSIAPADPKPSPPPKPEFSATSLPEQGMVPQHRLSLVRRLEGSGVTAVSPKGAIGTYQITPDTARTYGFDPARLTEPEYNEQAATAILADLDHKFNGNLADVLVAYNAGPGRARQWIRSGRDFNSLPLETQKYLQHAQHIMGDLNTGPGPRANEQQAERQLNVRGYDDKWVPPDIEQLRPDKIPPMTTALFDKTHPAYGETAIRYLPDGTIVPAPEEVATYLQTFGKEAGIQFAVGNPFSQEAFNAEFRKTTLSKGGVPTEVARQVFVPDNSDDQMRAWWGLSKNQIFAHEAGHGLDSVFNGTTGKTVLTPELTKELTENSKIFRPKMWERNPKYNARNPELVADAFASLLTDPTAKARLPLFWEKYGDRTQKYIDIANTALPKLVGGKWYDPGEAPEVDAQGKPIAATGGGVGGGGKEPPGKPPGPHGPEFEGGGQKPKKIETTVMKKEWPDFVARAFDRIQQPGVKANINFDWLNPRKLIATFESQLAPAVRLDRKVGTSPTELGIEDMMRSTYGSAGRANQFFHTGVLDAMTMDKVNDASFVKANDIVRAGKGNTRDFVAYRIYSRAMELAQRNINTPFTEDAPDALASIPAKLREVYRKANEVMQASKNGAIDYARDSGLFTTEAAEHMKDLGQDHIVLRRVTEPSYNPPRPGKGFAVRNPVKKIKGSDLDVVDPNTTELDNLHTMIAMADRNRALGNIIGIIEKHNADLKPGDNMRIPFEKIGQRGIEAPGKFGSALNGELFDAEGNKIDMSGREKEVASALEPFLAHKTFQGAAKPDDFIFYRQGKAEVWRATDPDLATMLRTQWPDRMMNNAFTKTFENFAKIQKAGITGQVEFPFRAVLHGQLARAVAGKGSNIARIPYMSVMRGLWSAIKMDGEWDEWERKGGAGVAMNDVADRYLKNNVAEAYDKPGIGDRVLNAVNHPYEAWLSVQHMVDAAARVGDFSLNKEAGFSPIKAAMQSRTNFLDYREQFATRFVETWSRAVSFMPVGFKDVQQAVRAMRERPGVTLLSGFSVLTMPTLLNYMANTIADQSLPEKDRYDNQSRWLRDMYWVLPPINGHRMLVKKPYVLGYVFSTIPERFLDYLRDESPRAFNTLMKQMVEDFDSQVMPPLTPSIIQPGIDTKANKTFSGRPLVPDRLRDASGPMQFTPDTTETAKAISNLLGKPIDFFSPDAGPSPIVVQDWIKEMTGPLPLRVIRTVEGEFKPPDRLPQLSDNPFVGSFIARNQGAGQTVEDYYTAMDAVKAAHRDLALAIQNNSPELIMRTSKNPLAMLQMKDTADAIRSASAVIASIQRDHDNPQTGHVAMTDTEKSQRIESLYSMIYQMAKVGLKQIDAVNKGK